ncbi:hypothetical protein [Dictyobacter formicarum]|uniref:Uncharacterized protein n=1 Tax=Dictyobacter formicarum TaxID=2778368 RepID=A0ABQ3VHW0_9CHLR|nr:hypothetical protein [Dictyobacter formicarum]GHO84963.1 hypothetical protein KSZ_29690 [Dictyobacter formicarum]
METGKYEYNSNQSKHTFRSFTGVRKNKYPMAGGPGAPFCAGAPLCFADGKFQLATHAGELTIAHPINECNNKIDPSLFG